MSTYVNKKVSRGECVFVLPYNTPVELLRRLKEELDRCAVLGMKEGVTSFPEQVFREHYCSSAHFWVEPLVYVFVEVDWPGEEEVWAELQAASGILFHSLRMDDLKELLP